MVYALMSGGGKNATLALDRARRDNMDVAYLVSIYTGVPSRARFHGTPRVLIEQQARSLGLEPIAIDTAMSDLESAFDETLSALHDLGVQGVVFGDISLDSVRAWYEERVIAAGLEHIEPNWGDPSIEIAWEVVERGYQALVVSVNRGQRAAKFLGREFDADLVTEIGCTDAIDPSGERGEYHTFVFDGPAFNGPVGFAVGSAFDFEGNRLVELTPSATLSF
jgi:uncharacterized protein (TIGR00290 family)